MWLHLEHSCSYGKLCFTHWEQLISFGHSGILVCSCVHVWLTIRLSQTVQPLQEHCLLPLLAVLLTAQPQRIKCLHLTLCILFSHTSLPHVLFNSIHKSLLCNFLGLSSFSYKKENCTWHNVTGIKSLKCFCSENRGILLVIKEGSFCQIILLNLRVF